MQPGAVRMCRRLWTGMSNIDISAYGIRSSRAMPATLKPIGIGILVGAVIATVATVGYFKLSGTSTSAPGPAAKPQQATGSTTPQDLSKVPAWLGGTLDTTQSASSTQALPELKVTSVASASVLAEGTPLNQQKRSYTIRISSDTKIQKESCTFNPKGGIGALWSCSTSAASISDIVVGADIAVMSTTVLRGTETEVTAKSIVIRAPQAALGSKP